MCLERLTVRNGSMIRNIFGLFSCKNQGKNGYFPVMYSNKRTGYAKDKNLRNSKKRKKNDRHVVLSMRNCRFIKKKASGKARMAGKIEKGTSVWNKKTGKMA